MDRNIAYQHAVEYYLFFVDSASNLINMNPSCHGSASNLMNPLCVCTKARSRAEAVVRAAAAAEQLQQLEIQMEDSAEDLGPVGTGRVYGRAEGMCVCVCACVYYLGFQSHFKMTIMLYTWHSCTTKFLLLMC